MGNFNLDFPNSFFVSLGVRIVKLTKPQTLLDILENEIDFLEHCVDNPFGKLLLIDTRQSSS